MLTILTILWLELDEGGRVSLDFADGRDEALMQIIAVLENMTMPLFKMMRTREILCFW
jgi:hypothetical protein